MSSPRDEELSHPLEQVTGEKDVHSAEEQGSAAEEAADTGQQEQDAADAGEGPPSEGSA